MTNALVRDGLAIVAIVTKSSNPQQLDSMLMELDGLAIKVFDNASLNQAELRAVCVERGASFVASRDNSGLAKHLNSIVAAQNHDQTKMLYLDQDSRISDKQVHALLTSVRDHEASSGSTIGLLCPSYRQLGTDHSAYSKRRLRRRVVTPIGSGSVYDLAACREVGGFDEALPLDMCDFDMALRLHDGGYRVIVDQSIVVGHEVGNRGRGRGVGVAECHPPWRYYTKSRAARRLATRHIRSHPSWVTRMLIGRCIETTRSSFATRDFAVITEALRGFFHLESRRVPEGILATIVNSSKPS
ncbi:MAG: glycosyltransferase family 2 protein [Acidimicrobiales bacterium]